MKKAFTLAEVLITLGIIGVVAALTLPNLLQNHAKKVLEASQKVAINEISSSAAMAMIDSNATIFQESDGYTNRNLFQNYVKISRRCNDSYLNCFGSDRYVDEDNKQIEVEDYIPDNAECAVSNKGYAACYSDDVGFIDLNGNKGPNKIGVDLLGLVIDSSGTAVVTEAQSTSKTIALDYSACGKIKAIKAYKSVCGLRLKESKEMIEQNSSKLSCPDKSKNKQLKTELIAAGCTVN